MVSQKGIEADDELLHGDLSPTPVVEGLFGNPTIEFFYGCDWSRVTTNEYVGMLGAYLR